MVDIKVGVLRQEFCHKNAITITLSINHLARSIASEFYRII